MAGYYNLRPYYEILQIKWFNHSLVPFYSDEDYYGIPSKSYLSLDVPAQDPRLVYIEKNDSLLIASTNHINHPTRFASTELFINSSNSMQLKNLYWALQPSTYPNQNHKNWTPFLFNDSIYYIELLKPFNVVKVIGNVRTGVNNSQLEAVTALVSSTNPAFEWPFGHVRGGTPAIWINASVGYLAFFHSSTQLPDHYKKTYFFGAYTFSSSPPFHMTTMSKCPILNEKVYSGPFHFHRLWNIDYIAFPTSYYLRGDTIMLSIGHQDARGLLVEIKLDNLLRTMEAITSN